MAAVVIGDIAFQILIVSHQFSKEGVVAALGGNPGKGTGLFCLARRIHFRQSRTDTQQLTLIARVAGPKADCNPLCGNRAPIDKVGLQGNGFTVMRGCRHDLQASQR